ncbi:Alpha/Beta hydrolase protein [Catenaria anguillulae PL171]|uniref:Alpha/Beta hydrolase protein n=1 Tax=Catenaria anguillulae PL171 TaxID=765915 RepID=A0A1Y2HCE3_9FUNG|nr:Alpha/Beta hydrolase protein [Catenaria anguillulae PL171]
MDSATLLGTKAKSNRQQRQHDQPASDAHAARPPTGQATGTKMLLAAAVAAAVSQSSRAPTTDPVPPSVAPSSAPQTSASVSRVTPTAPTPRTEEETHPLVISTTLDPALPLARPSPSPSRYHDFHLAPHFHAPVHPIVLCHGLFGFDYMDVRAIPAVKWRIHYWRGIAEALQEIGCKVYVARVPSAGNVHSRALALYRFLEENEIRHANLIAHSMGGLDARYLLSRLGPPPSTRIHTLTTISTPHRGSPMMDWFAAWFGVGKHVGDDHPERDPQMEALRKVDPYANHPLAMLMRALDLPAYAHLTTWYVKHVFNPAVRDVPSDQTEYLSYGAWWEIPVYAPLRIPYEIVKAKEGENDGLVSLTSAQWGRYLGTLPTDHWGLTNRWLSSKINRHFDAPGFYLTHATKLWKEGY